MPGVGSSGFLANHGCVLLCLAPFTAPVRASQPQGWPATPSRVKPGMHPGPGSPQAARAALDPDGGPSVNSAAAVNPGLHLSARTEDRVTIAELAGELDIASVPGVARATPGLAPARFRPADHRPVPGDLLRRQWARRAGRHRTPGQAARRIPAPGRRPTRGQPDVAQHRARPAPPCLPHGQRGSKCPRRPIRQDRWARSDPPPGQR